VKKFLFFLIVLALGAYAGAAYMFGGQAREQYFSALEKYERYGFFSLANQSYERGFFTSTAQTVVELRVPEGLADSNATGAVRFIVSHDLRHGPLTGEGADFFRKPGLMRVVSTVEPLTTDQMSQDLFSRIPELAQATSEVLVGFDGEVAGDVLVPAIDRTIDGEHVAWGGLALQGEYVPLIRSLRGEVTMPSLMVKTGDGTMELEALSSDFDLVEVLPLVYAGQVDVGISAMNFIPAEGDAVRVRNLRISSNSSCDGSLYNYAQVLGVESVNVSGSTYGPASCELAGKNIDAAALSEFQINLQQLYHSMTDTDSEIFFDQVGELYAGLFTKILAGKPELHMPLLQVTTPMGEFTGAFSVKLLSPVADTALNPLLLLQHLEADAKMAAHEELLKGLLRIGLEKEHVEGDLETVVQQRYAEQIEPLLARNLIVREDGSIKTQAMFAKGRLTVNGQDMPLF
jgi:uncharacterized protein YdgA (DUF945 family)